MDKFLRKREQGRQVQEISAAAGAVYDKAAGAVGRGYEAFTSFFGGDEKITEKPDRATAPAAPGGAGRIAAEGGTQVGRVKQADEFNRQTVSDARRQQGTGASSGGGTSKLTGTVTLLDPDHLLVAGTIETDPGAEFGDVSTIPGDARPIAT